MNLNLITIAQIYEYIGQTHEIIGQTYQILTPKILPRHAVAQTAQPQGVLHPDSPRQPPQCLPPRRHPAGASPRQHCPRHPQFYPTPEHRQQHRLAVGQFAQRRLGLYAAAAPIGLRHHRRSASIAGLGCCPILDALCRYHRPRTPNLPLLAACPRPSGSALFARPGVALAAVDGRAKTHHAANF
jgi:hypothetical protein